MNTSIGVSRCPTPTYTELLPRRRIQLAVKRAMDLTLSLAVLEISLPVMLALVPIVKLSSPGPVFFVQQRSGLKGRPFNMYKFRTMAVRPDGAQELAWSEAEQARVTRAGQFMRDFGLDELPQLINILKGDMSIIGPRPPLPEQAQDFTPEQRVMFEMRPGVLSLAAIEGRRSIPVTRRLELHAQYVKRWSLSLDLYILWRSIFVVLGRENANEVGG